MSKSRGFESPESMKLERSIRDATEMTPAAVTGLRALENTHAVMNTYSPDRAENLPLSGNQAGLLRKIALILSPLFLAFGWVSFFMSVASLVQGIKENNKSDIPYDKNFRARLWFDVVVNFLAAAGSTLAMVFLFSGLAYLAPYIITAVLGVNAIYGLCYTAMHLYLAFSLAVGSVGENRLFHLKKAGSYILGIVINSLAIVLNIFIFQTARLLTKGIHDFASDILSVFLHFQELMDLINGPVMAGVNVIKMAGIGWLASTSLWLLIAAAKLNKQTYQLLRKKPLADAIYEKKVTDDLSYFFRAIIDPTHKRHVLKRMLLLLIWPIVALSYGLTFMVHAVVIRLAAALLVGAPQLLYLGLSAGVKYCCGSKQKNLRELRPEGVEDTEEVVVRSPQNPALPGAPRRSSASGVLGITSTEKSPMFFTTSRPNPDKPNDRGNTVTHPPLPTVKSDNATALSSRGGGPL